ncbi:MAG: Na/Pi cotransporter family protein [Opitutales bacterium]|nr:Na/Pi cotransporter family protein [Opitutales bacterium]
MALFFQVLGSLGVFLFGMRLMSESIQKFSGERLRSIMSSMTGNRFAGVTTGFLVTCLVQSSSATTVMVISFVHARLLTLVQAIGVIMGANLGTTTTFWVISLLGFKFSLSTIAIPVIGIGVSMSFLKAARLKEIGNFMTGFGLLFMGLSLLKKAVPDIKSNPEALEWISSLGNYGFGSIIIFIFVGVVLTVVVQSSSVAGAITLTMAYKGWIDYPQAAAIILGENIGTTITAYLASITANTAAKRAARAHFMFNIIGVIWMLALFVPFTNLVDLLMPGDPEFTIIDADGVSSKPSLPNHMAMFHTLFNLVNIGMLIAFVPKIAQFVEWMIKDKPSAARGAQFRYLDTMSWGSGEMNFSEAKHAIGKLGELSGRMFKQFLFIYNNPQDDLSPKVKEINEMEKESNEITGELFEFLIHCSSDQVSEETREEATSYLRVIAELEEVCDCCHRLTNRAAKRYRKNRFIPKEIEDDIVQFGENVQRFIDFYQARLQTKVSASDMEVAVDLEDMINDKRRKYRKKAVARMTNNNTEVHAELIYIEIVNTFERIANHSRNILQALPQDTSVTVK